MTTGDWIALAGDIVVFVALLVTLIIYMVQRSGSIRREITSTLELLRAVRDGITPWGNKHFTTSYLGDLGIERSKQDYAKMMERTPFVNFRVPTETLNALVQQPETGLLIEKDTIQAANYAMWKIGIFNQLVQQQTDFLALHMAEINDETLPTEKLEALAKAAQKFSELIHCMGIEDAGWYGGLLAALAINIRHLEVRLQRPKHLLLRRPTRPSDT